MNIIKNLLDRIDLHCEADRISVSTFGRLVVNDGKFVGNLRAGKTITVATAEKVSAYLDEHQSKTNDEAAE